MKKPTEKRPPQAGKPTEKPASKGTMEKPLWESGKRSVKINGKRYSAKAYYTAKKAGIALGECTEAGFWAMVHAARVASGEEEARKLAGQTGTLEEAKENRKTLAAKKSQAKALVLASPLYAAFVQAGSAQKHYITLTQEDEKRLFVGSMIAKGYDEHSAEKLWDEKKAKRRQKEEEARARSEKQAQEAQRKRDLEGWERKGRVKKPASGKRKRKPRSLASPQARAAKPPLAKKPPPALKEAIWDQWKP